MGHIGVWLSLVPAIFSNFNIPTHYARQLTVAKQMVQGESNMLIRSAVLVTSQSGNGMLTQECLVQQVSQGGTCCWIFWRQRQLKFSTMGICKALSLLCSKCPHVVWLQLKPCWFCCGNDSYLSSFTGVQLPLVMNPQAYFC